MKNLLTILTVLLFSFISISSYAISENKSKEQDNYVILLDLSDRMLNPNQAELDKAVIMECFEQFERHVKRHLYIKSKARFSVIIIPQKGVCYNIYDYNNKLSIDLSVITPAQKRKAVEQFSKKLSSLLNELYKQAYQGSQTSNYYGVDIWKYFYNQLSYDLLENYNNQIIVLTDGYFDFESHHNVKKQENYFTSTQFFKFLSSNNWKQISEKQNFGILPITQKKFTKAHITVIGISPKNEDLFEQEKLIYFWTKWVNDMHFKSIECIPLAGQTRVLQRMRKIL